MTTDPRSFAPRLSVSWLAEDPTRRHRVVDGALVFLDVSGFTALSERLADLGRIGAEEITHVINSSFRALLEPAYRRGGSLLKFGGDAVLLLFDGPDAAVRASASARLMLDTLLARNPVMTSGGSVVLGATVGVHRGAIDLFLLGERHRELLLVGETVSRTIRTESTATRDQILVTDDVAAALPPGHTAPHEQPGLALLTSVPPTEHAEIDTWWSPGASTPDGAWQLLPDALRTHLQSGHTAAQHRRATVAFIDIAGADEVLASEGPEAAADALEAVVLAAADACDRYSVTWLSSDVNDGSCKIILTAGVPTGDDDDDDRIVHAARAVAACDGRLRVRVGVHRGPLFAGTVGPPYRLTYTILGDAVNLAARTMGRAEPGQVLATASVVNDLRTLYELEVIEPFRVKGKTQPVRAAVVGEALGTRARDRAGDIPFTGRVPEIGALMAALDAATDGRGSAVALVGPAGIGKSRLVDELQDRRPGVPHLLVACTRFSVDRPYRTVATLLRLALTGERHGPGADVLAAAAEVISDELRPLLPVLGTVYDVAVPDTSATAALDPAHLASRIRAVLGELLAAALQGTTVLTVEDAHWMDPESHDLLAASVTSTLPSVPWLLVMTSRQHLDLPDAVHEIAVGPLSEADAWTFGLELVDDGLVSFDLVGPLVARADGNPLFLRELAVASKSGELPDDVESLVRQRLDALPPDHLRLVQHAAVLGNEFPPDLLRAVTRNDAALATVTIDDVPDLLGQMRSGYIRFRQSLYQEVAYEALPFRDRRDLHRTAAEALAHLADEGVDIAPEARSRHHHLAQDYDASWRWSRAALDAAIARAAPTTAARFARRALEAAGAIGVPAVERADVWGRLGDALEVAGGYDDALDAYRRARRLHRPSPSLCRRTGHVLERTGRYEQALRWYRRGLGEIPALADGDGDRAATAERLEIEMRRTITLLRRGQVQRAITLGEAVLAEAEGLGNDHVLGYLTFALAWAYADAGDQRQVEMRRRADQHFARTGDLHGSSMIANESGAAAYWRGDWDAAVADYRRCADLKERLGDVVNGAIARSNIGEVLADQGHLDQAVEQLSASLRVLEVAENTIGVLTCRQYLARALARRGDFMAAESEYAASLELAAAVSARGIAHVARVHLAEVAAMRGDVSLAVERLREVDEHRPTEVAGTTQVVEHRVRAVCSAIAGDADAVRTSVEAALALVEEHDLVHERALCLAVQAWFDADQMALDESDAILVPLGAALPAAVLAIGPTLADRPHASVLR